MKPNTIESISLAALSTISGGTVRSSSTNATTQLMLQQMQTQLTTAQQTQQSSTSTMLPLVMALAMRPRFGW